MTEREELELLEGGHTFHFDEPWDGIPPERRPEIVALVLNDMYNGVEFTSDDYQDMDGTAHLAFFKHRGRKEDKPYAELTPEEREIRDLRGHIMN